VRRNKKTLVVASAAAVLVFAGAAAFTASIGFSNNNTVVGYGAEVITGATVTSLSYVLSGETNTPPNGTQTIVDTVNFVTAEDTSSSQQTSSVSFTTNASGSPVETTWVPCSVSSAYVSGTGTGWTCDVTSLTQATANLVGVQITVQ